MILPVAAMVSTLPMAPATRSGERRPTSTSPWATRMRRSHPRLAVYLSSKLRKRRSLMRRRNTRSASRYHHPLHHHPLGKNLIRKNQRSLNSRRKSQNRKLIFLNWTQHQYQNRNQTSTSWQVYRHSQSNRLKPPC